MPKDLKNKVFKQPMNHRMIGPTLKPQVVNDNRKKDLQTIDEETKIPSFAIICGSLGILIRIRVEVEK
jgi:hypothetical protein